MTQEIAHSDALGRHRVVQTKLGNVVAHRLRPIEPPLIVQQRHARRGEGFGDRADQELRCGGCRKIRLDISVAVGPHERNFPILHDRESCAWHLPISHGIDGETIELKD